MTQPSSCIDFFSAPRVHIKMEHIRIQVNSNKEYVKLNLDLQTVTIETFAIYIAQLFNVQVLVLRR